ncbi:MAG TPA: class I SAM-dependent methyltransferase [Streptosporangiaceae bacterium]|nr:class I SAM-dependent methyltransferase [Streptosporangiaceae bacterium]
MRDEERAEIEAYYARGEERDRLAAKPKTIIEFERTREIILRSLPPAPSLVADIGGGPGRYTQWLAGLGYHVEHRDLMPLHVEQVRAALGETGQVRAMLGDALDLDLPDSAVDAVLLLGPIYHLKNRADRIKALREAARIVRPGGPVFVAAISRWAPRLDGELSQKLYEKYPHSTSVLPGLERRGWMPPLHPAAFTAYCHRPGQLRSEVRAAGLAVADLVSVEGAAWLIGDLDERLANQKDWQAVLDTVRATERVPELLGIGPHLLVTAVREGGAG